MVKVTIKQTSILTIEDASEEALKILKDITNISENKDFRKLIEEMNDGDFDWKEFEKLSWAITKVLT